MSWSQYNRCIERYTYSDTQVENDGLTFEKFIKTTVDLDQTVSWLVSNENAACFP